MSAAARLLRLLPALLLSGCFALSGLDERGTDIAQLRVGMARGEVERVLGTPLREQVAADGRTRCVYRYEIVDQEYGARAALLVFDVVGTFGLFSLFCSLGDECPGARRESGELLLVYDGAGRLATLETLAGTAPPGR